MAPRKPKTLVNIVEEGSELEILKGLRIKIASTIDESNSGRDVAALSKQLREVSERISEVEGTKLDSKNISILDLICLKSELQGRKRANAAEGIEDEDLDIMLDTVEDTLTVARETESENDG